MGRRLIEGRELARKLERVAEAYEARLPQEEMFVRAGLSRAPFYRYLKLAVREGLVKLRSPRDDLSRARLIETRRKRVSFKNRLAAILRQTINPGDLLETKCNSGHDSYIKENGEQKVDGAAGLARILVREFQLRKLLDENG